MRKLDVYTSAKTLFLNSKIIQTNEEYRTVIQTFMNV